MNIKNIQIITEKLNISHFYEIIQKNTENKEKHIKLKISISSEGFEIKENKHKIRLEYSISSENIPLIIDWVLLIYFESENEINYEEVFKENPILDKIDEKSLKIQELIGTKLPLFSDIFKEKKYE
ncbi:hypothetical protein [uncultured Methanobrevibacter sp.]|uniref:hypothetical protein n=1 Tax=uncultured Methanobrevibacter sp. TaxID=253161 RepID=UPI002636D466|nr:hypothetical protein [uncultured Methanobrevibacter sp.]